MNNNGVSESVELELAVEMANVLSEPDSTHVSGVDVLATGAHKYRGAVVEDLQLPPAFALPHSETIARAIELAYDRDFSHIPILSRERKPLGYLDVTALKAKWEAGQADPNDNVLKYMMKFKRGPSQTYTLITPDTPLNELEDFLKNNLFALASQFEVTDYDRKFVLAVATQGDLDTFISRRGV
ncbi:hypothetical protein EW145_g2883 [Phellinidium pouzarii]|uniref:CBS domain-containing protein n=1 Tax=Phellinidium pouzarii TaxID=167371 RepID=A0A4S4L944_9AGAM|nr:hypothetical protein EW145_g2883 [Phellinidium pouzarii]